MNILNIFSINPIEFPAIYIIEFILWIGVIFSIICTVGVLRLNKKIQKPRLSFAQIQYSGMPTNIPTDDFYSGYDKHTELLWQVLSNCNPVNVYMAIMDQYNDSMKPKIMPVEVLHPAMSATVLFSSGVYTASIIADPNSVVLTEPQPAPAPVAEATPDVSTPGTATLRDVIAFARYMLERVFENNFRHSNSMLYEPALLQSAKKLFLILNHMEQSQPRGSPATT